MSGTGEQVQIALVQQGSALDPELNRVAVAELAGHRPVAEADLVVLPEAFARDFGSPRDDLARYAEPVGGPFTEAVSGLAGEQRTVVAGMFERSEDPARPFNTLLVRGAAKAEYRKIHLYDSFGYRESDRLTAGPLEPVTFALGGFTVGLLTCYDLRFPELARALVERGADLLVIPAAWVAGRDEAEHKLKIHHWETLVRARAIENVCYVAAVGQPGPRYTGHSMVVDPRGEVMVRAGAGEQVISALLDPDAVATARAANPSLANRRAFPG
ncbi:carbon-nitrogen hydrolase family protein [Nocardioides dubius]|uniref:Carbon-nitrogen hydrolase family protein n=1 Tax=Nocardioides dubius TaxID=317019 RepID=A0ABN1TUP5_9ACTN